MKTLNYLFLGAHPSMWLWELFHADCVDMIMIKDCQTSMTASSIGRLSFLTPKGLNVPGVTKLVLGSITTSHTILRFLKLFETMCLAISLL
jgi:hypothetical protein